MTLFSIEGGNLSRISEAPFKLEKELQKLVEKNMQNIFGIDFVASEFEIDGMRIDTLGFDKKSKSFVIIEYKRTKNSTVLDQGLIYRSLINKNKTDFLYEHNEHTNKPLKKEDVNWNESKILFVSPMFTVNQKRAYESTDIPIELWEVKRYSNGIVSFDKIESQEKTESLNKKVREMILVGQAEYVETKKCPKCKKEKNISRDFGFRIVNGKKYVQSQCIECR